MRSRCDRSARPLRRDRRLLPLVGVAVAVLLAGCVPGNPVAPDRAASDRLPSGSYYLRTIDGRALPMTISGGGRIEAGFMVADSAETGLVGFGESIGRDASSSARLATGTARVLGQDYRSARIASISWQDAAAGARADSALWSADSVIVYRTGAGPSIAGAGHRLVYTRAIPSDTL